MPQRRRYKKQRPAKLIGFKAFRDTDKDIIDWWEGLPMNQASEVLRTLIRDHMASEGDDDLMVRQIETLRIDMNTQFRALSQQLRQMVVVAPTAPVAPESEQLSRAEIAERTRAILNQKW